VRVILQPQRLNSAGSKMRSFLMVRWNEGLAISLLQMQDLSKAEVCIEK
jgi:hypothetical protein